MQVRNKWNKFIIVAGGVLFLIQFGFLFIYLNWPFGSSADRSYLPFIAVAISMLGYLLALWKGKYGGLIMICGALILAISIFINPREIELFVKVIFALISCAPTIVVGVLFIYQETKSKLIPT
jgi:hypothetical protein